MSLFKKKQIFLLLTVGVYTNLLYAKDIGETIYLEFGGVNLLEHQKTLEIKNAFYIDKDSNIRTESNLFQVNKTDCTLRNSLCLELATPELNGEQKKGYDYLETQKYFSWKRPGKLEFMAIGDLYFKYDNEAYRCDNLGIGSIEDDVTDGIKDRSILLYSNLGRLNSILPKSSSNFTGDSEINLLCRQVSADPALYHLFRVTPANYNTNTFLISHSINVSESGSINAIPMYLNEVFNTLSQEQKNQAFGNGYFNISEPFIIDFTKIKLPFDTEKDQETVSQYGDADLDVQSDSHHTFTEVENTSDFNQNMSTTSFSLTTTEQTSATSINTLGGNIEVGGNLNFANPAIFSSAKEGGLSFKIGVNYSHSWQRTTTTTTTKQWTLPPQNVLVPSRCKAVVTASLGEVRLNSLAKYAEPLKDIQVTGYHLNDGGAPTPYTTSLSWYKTLKGMESSIPFLYVDNNTRKGYGTGLLDVYSNLVMNSSIKIRFVNCKDLSKNGVTKSDIKLNKWSNELTSSNIVVTDPQGNFIKQVKLK